MSTSQHILNKKLDGKVAIITGAAGGIGTTVSKLFAAHGAQVIMADLTDEVGHRKASEIGPNAHYRHCDITKEEDVASAVDFAMEKFGKLDIMYNNAGIVTKVESLLDMELEYYDQAHAVMVRGVIAGIKHAARVMVPASQGVILTTGSIAGNFVSDDMPLAYTICKHNLPGLTKIAASRLGRYGIRVNAISPHGICTPMVVEWLRQTGVQTTNEAVMQSFIKHSNLLGKTVTEDDIANGALFLCSDDSRYVSGQNLIVDGGWCDSKDYPVVRELLLAAAQPAQGHGT